jgi:hypothetical protein
MTVHLETPEFDDGAPAVKFQRRTPALSTPEHMKNTPRDTPGDEASVDFLQDLNVVSHSVGSASVTDTGILQALAATGKPVILHATSPYPLPAEEANLRTITTLGQRYPGVPVGCSGHERGVQISLAAVALGAAEQTAESLPTATVTVLAIADSDSYLKWGATLLGQLPEGWQRSLIVLASPVMPSGEQLAVALKGTTGSIAAPPILDLSALAVRIAILKPDVALLSVRGPLVRVVVRAIVGASVARPVIVSGLPGILIPATKRAIAHRAKVDLFVLHSRREVREFEEPATSMGIDMPFGLATLPFLPRQTCPQKTRGRTQNGEVIFTTQAKVPAGRADRLALLGWPSPRGGIRTCGRS